jgi:colicin import membrane protein
MMKKIALIILLSLPLTMQGQTVVNDAKQKAEMAKKAAEEAAKKAEEARIAALKAEEAARAAEEAAKAEMKAKAENEKKETSKAAKDEEKATKIIETEAKVDKTKRMDEKPDASYNKWETKKNERALMPTTKESATPNPDAKYLEGAVPEVNGHVEWNLSIDVPGRSAEWIYNKLGQLFTDMTHGEGQMEQSRVALADEVKHILGVRFQEWLVFRSSTLSLDRTEFNYTVIAECKDGHADVKLGRISYVYEENRGGGQNYKAEEWIIDKYGLNKSKTKLAKLSGKFRRKTIDRKDYIFKEIKNTLLLED